MLLTALLAFAIAVTVMPLIRRAMLRLGVVDVPNERSSHREVTPRGGGLGVALAVIAAVLVAADVQGTVRVAVLVAGGAFGAVGLLEDVIGIPALRRLPLLFAAAAAALPWLVRGMDGPWLWRVLFTGAVLVWLVAYANAFNFMDGINGLAAGHVVVVGVAWFALGMARDVAWLSAVGIVLAAAAAGFAPHNLPRARLFLGDVGSYFLGAVLACTAVLALRAGLPPEAVLAPLALYLADTGGTLLRRVRRGDAWYAPHREHTYQRLSTLLDDSHPRTTAAVVLAMALCAALGQLSLTHTFALRLIGDALIVAVLAIYLSAPARLSRAERTKPVLA